MQIGVACSDLELFFREDIQQWGVRATKALPKSTIIAEYVGLIQPKKLSNISSSASSSASKPSITTSFVVQESSRIEIDAKRFRNLAYFVNGCCKRANVKIQAFLGNARTSQLEPNLFEKNMKRLFLMTQRRIKKGEELEICYDSKNPKNYLDGARCKCSACRLND